MSTLKVNVFQDTSGKGWYPARAWGNFDGTGTIAFRDSAGASSLTDNGGGDYTVSFSNSFSNANYSMSGAAGGQMSTYGSRTILWNQAFSTGSNRFRLMWQPNSSYYDSQHVCFTIDGDM